jgi:acetoacetyl-CoA synthetase
MCNGSPFGADGYKYVYSSIKKDVHLVSPSGGTDSCGSLVSNNPNGPVWAGEIQGKALGFKIEIFNQDGKSVVEEAGELVVTQPFPSMPIEFLGDKDGTRYHNAYFNHFAGVWRHGDWAKLTERGGVIIYGRSDSTLKAGGVRIGTADLYRTLATMPEIAESVAIAQEKDGDSRILLFVQLQPGAELNSDLLTRIRHKIRHELSPRHVPSKIFPVEAIPLTVTGKVSEAAVNAVIHGREVKNQNALQNPEALRFYTAESIPELLT